MYTPSSTRSVAMTVRRVASGLLPTAETWRPGAVSRSANQAMRYSASISTAPQTMAVWPSANVPPSRVMPSGMSVMVCASEYNCVIANAMFIVPSVTMNGGSAILVTNRPLTRPNSTVTAMPQAIASGADRSWLAAILVITMLPSAITMPQDRSMPAVRITSVWPIAITATTMTCCRISEKFCADKKRSLCEAKKAQARISAMKGPSVASVTCGGRRKVIDGMWGWLRARVKRVHGAPADAAQRAWPSRRWSPPCRAGVAGATLTGAWRRRQSLIRLFYFLPQHRLAPVFTSWLSTPACGFASNHPPPPAGLRLGCNQRHAGVGIAAGLLAGLGVLDARRHTHGRHAQRVLLAGGGNHPPVDIGDAGATAVHRH